MTTISPGNTGTLYVYGIREQESNKDITRASANDVIDQNISEDTKTFSAINGSDLDTVTISKIKNLTSHVYSGYWVPSKTGGNAAFYTDGVIVNGVAAKNLPGAEAGTHTETWGNTSETISGTYASIGEGASSIKSFKITENAGSVSVDLHTIQNEEIVNLFEDNKREINYNENAPHNKISTKS